MMMKNKISTQDIVALMQLPKVGRKTAYRLITELKHAISGRSDLADYVNETGKQYRLPNYSSSEIQAAYDDADRIQDQSEKQGINVISFLDEKYPKQLLELPDLPITLSYKGNIETLTEKPNVAVIGTREPSEYGARIGERFGECFAALHFNVVSGLALGCDTAGHVGALKGKGTTAAVLAHGVDYIYPKENKNLAQEIVDKGGVLVSEYFVNQRPLSNFFVERDRIQAGLSQSVVIVETDVKGGTMHTAKYCLEYKRKLVCFNHPIEYRSHPKAQGNQKLINEGSATPITSKDEIDMLSFLLLDGYLESQDSAFANWLFMHAIEKIIEKDGHEPPEMRLHPRTIAAGIAFENTYHSLLNTIVKDQKIDTVILVHPDSDHIPSFTSFSNQAGGSGKKIYMDFLREIYDNMLMITDDANRAISKLDQLKTEDQPAQQDQVNKKKSDNGKETKHDTNYKLWEE